jgi:NAD(P)-dependent dehydrogenase (short-subunit alcohol dehydrogenase family)
MTTTTNADRIEHVPELRGQTIVVIGGRSGIGLETARRVCGEGADLILGARDANVWSAPDARSGHEAHRRSTRAIRTDSSASSRNCRRRLTT